jgi:RNA polymerase sigma-70 factor (ECF subfamily)
MKTATTRKPNAGPRFAKEKGGRIFDVDRQETTELLVRARDGSSDALNEVYGRVAGRLLALIRLRLGRGLRGQVESRDVLQATLLKSLEHIDGFQGAEGSSLMAWLARIAENEIRDLADYHHRQKRDARRNVPLSGAAADLAANVRSISSQVVLEERAVRLEQGLESLPLHYREIVVLRKLEEMSWSEIAERLGKSEDACRMLLARAMASLTLNMEADR